MKTFKLSTQYGEIFIQDSEVKGAVCMLLHGNSQSSNQFKEQFAALGEKYRLIAWDLPGHGESDKLTDPTLYNIETYAAIGHLIIEALDIAPVALLGWSLGGHVAIEMIRTFQSNIQALMLTGTPPCELSEQGLKQAFKWNDDISRLALTEEWTLDDAKSWVAYSGLTPDQYPEAVKAALKADGTSRTNMIKHLTSRKDNQLTVVKNFNGPVDIVIGINDQHINNAYITTHVQNLKIFSGFRTMQTGHSTFLEQPEAFNEHFVEFMNKVLK